MRVENPSLNRGGALQHHLCSIHNAAFLRNTRGMKEPKVVYLALFFYFNLNFFSSSSALNILFYLLLLFTPFTAFHVKEKE